MMKIDNKLISKLLSEAAENPREIRYWRVAGDEAGDGMWRG